VVAAVALVAVVAIALATTGGSSRRTPTRTAAEATVPLTPSPGGGLPSPGLTVPNPNLQTPTTPQAPTQAAPSQGAPAPVASEPTVDWLGMEIQDSPGGTPVIDSVAGNGAAAAAGLDPGDQLSSVNGTQITGVGQIAAAIAHVRLGQKVQIDVDRGSLLLSVEVTLTGRPVARP
jgi:S1-C subfamily serine protease